MMDLYVVHNFLANSIYILCKESGYSISAHILFSSFTSPSFPKKDYTIKITAGL